jgi:hypothetical protein
MLSKQKFSDKSWKTKAITEVTTPCPSRPLGNTSEPPAVSNKSVKPDFFDNHSRKFPILW